MHHVVISGTVSTLCHDMTEVEMPTPVGGLKCCRAAINVHRCEPVWAESCVCVCRCRCVGGEGSLHFPSSSLPPLMMLSETLQSGCTLADAPSVLLLPGEDALHRCLEIAQLLSG